ncbi:hypothetical protein ACHQM5_025607 [Ranunculus cassubicifolius]
MDMVKNQHPLLEETTCGSLLHQLQKIWDEVGESDEDRDKMLLRLEQECLDVYRRHVNQAAKSRAQLLQALSDGRSELSKLVIALGEKGFNGVPDKSTGTIKEQLTSITPMLEQLLKQKEERTHEFADVQLQIQKLCGEISGNLKLSEDAGTPVVDESDLSMKRLEGFYSHLQELQREKGERLRKVLDLVSIVHDLCSVLGMDFSSTVTEVHPTLQDSVGVQSKSITDDTILKLSKLVVVLKDDKKQRLQKIQGLAAQLSDLWNLMDTPMEERNLFNHVTCNTSTLVDEVTGPGSLALDLIEQAEVEVRRLDQLKASRMKEIALKKQVELGEIYAHAHVAIDVEAAQKQIMALIDSGTVEPSELLTDMDSQIAKAKEEALSRKDILDRVEKWMSACEEESWLEDYSRDDNRYSASRGAHINLKRAEKARILVNKIPGMVETLVGKTRAWEQLHGTSFTYDGVPLLAMLDEYALLRHDREEEKKKMRDQKKFHEQLATEQETLFGSKPTPSKSIGTKKVAGAPRGNGVNGTPRRLSMNTNHQQSGTKGKSRPMAPVNYVALPKDDAASHVSNSDSIPASP